MGILDDPLRAAVTGVLQALGNTGTVKRVIPPTYNQLTGVETGGSTTLTVVNITPPSPYSLNQVDGTSIKRSDLRVMIPADQISFTPVPGDDIFIINSIEYKIVNVEPVPAGDLPCGYELQIRI